jgi:ABC-type oligopeptide transport system substrate-binding subunit
MGATAHHTGLVFLLAAGALSSACASEAEGESASDGQQLQEDIYGVLNSPLDSFDPGAHHSP